MAAAAVSQVLYVESHHVLQDSVLFKQHFPLTVTLMVFLLFYRTEAQCVPPQPHNKIKISCVSCLFFSKHKI